jgi:hypothetical protein
MKYLYNKTYLFAALAVIVYIVIAFQSFNEVFFWDSIQQISKEAHWFYLTDFKSLLIPAKGSIEGITATGYHPPLMGIITAFLWKIFGYHLWVARIFVFSSALILFYNLWVLINRFFEKDHVKWVFLIVLLESTLVTQFYIASPDFILFTAFVLSLRAILDRKHILLSIGIFLLCCINMRGVFIGGSVFAAHIYYTYLTSDKSLNLRDLSKIILPYLPTFFILLTYFAYYFIINGWFFADTTEDGHYSLPRSTGQIIVHFIEFVVRSAENGRFIVWIIGFIGIYFVLKRRIKLLPIEKTLFVLLLILLGLCLLLVVATQITFSARYFVPQFFILTILVLLGISKLKSKRNSKLIYILILTFELTGHFWVYPDKIAKSWDSTLAHVPYYELRKECFEYIDSLDIDYNEISAGFCLYGNRRFVELKHEDKTVGTDPNHKYFIYSNISNVEDSFAEELKNRTYWKPLKKFEKGFVFIELYENLQN